ADLGAEFHHRLMHLGLDVLFQNHFAAGKNLLNVRTQLARLRIDDLEFLFDSKSENMIGYTHFLSPHTRSSGRLSRRPAIQNKLGEAFFYLIEMILFEKGL